jgi:hypothetical protein
MTALANMMETLAIDLQQPPFVISDAQNENLDDFGELFELANDVYIATLETHIASLDTSNRLSSDFVASR